MNTTRIFEKDELDRCSKEWSKIVDDKNEECLDDYNTLKWVLRWGPKLLDNASYLLNLVEQLDKIR